VAIIDKAIIIYIFTTDFIVLYYFNSYQERRREQARRCRSSRSRFIGMSGAKSCLPDFIGGKDEMKICQTPLHIIRRGFFILNKVL